MKKQVMLGAVLLTGLWAAAPASAQIVGYVNADCNHITGEAYDTDQGDGYKVSVGIGHGGAPWDNFEVKADQCRSAARYGNGCHGFDVPTSRIVSGPNLFVTAVGSNNLGNQALLSGSPVTLTSCGQTFVKRGNNGTTDCKTFCEGSQWGRTGSCVGSQLHTLPCGKPAGYLKELQQQSCLCMNPVTRISFQKDGNNGTASCDDFCAGPDWGPVGTCVSANVQFTTQCDLTPGLGSPQDFDCFCQ